MAIITGFVLLGERPETGPGEWLYNRRGVLSVLPGKDVPRRLREQTLLSRLDALLHEQSKREGEEKQLGDSGAVL